jgi:hypothetical protein
MQVVSDQPALPKGGPAGHRPPPLQKTTHPDLIVVMKVAFKLGDSAEGALDSLGALHASGEQRA